MTSSSCLRLLPRHFYPSLCLPLITCSRRQCIFFSIMTSSSCLRLLPRHFYPSLCLPCNKLFRRQCIFFSIMTSSSCLRLTPHLFVLYVFPSLMRCRRQFLHKMWPIPLAFLLFIVCRIFLSGLTLCNTLHCAHWNLQDLYFNGNKPHNPLCLLCATKFNIQNFYVLLTLCFFF